MSNSHLFEEIKKYGLSEVGQHVFLDRYALKDKDAKRIQVGDLVVVHRVDRYGSSIIDKVSDLSYLQGALNEVVCEESGHVMVGMVDRPLESPPDMWLRVAVAASSVESGDKNSEYWSEKFYSILKDWKFLPGGRILASAGSETAQTGVNCFVLPHFEDTREGILKRLEEMIELMAHGGGVGINVSALRPRGSKTFAANGRSSGAVSWSEMFSHGTGLTSQGGSRRGALMIELEVWHPDILEFIEAKKNASRLTNANISVGISDEFMKAVKENKIWSLEFPDRTHPSYNKEWDGDFYKWKNSGLPTIIYKEIPATELWDKICQSAWESAEPGLWFSQRCQALSNSQYPRGLVMATNPCGEQVLPGYGVCNLGHINLSKYVDSLGVFDFESFEVDVAIAVRFLDNVIDMTKYPLDATSLQQSYERRIGLGTLGLHEALIRMGITYGSQQSLDFIDILYARFANIAYDVSEQLAEEKGPCKALVDHPEAKGFAAQMMRTKPRRNITLLTQAPTGTVGTMVGTSTGIEPFFAWKWTRKGKLGDVTESVKVYEDFVNENFEPGQPVKLPPWFVTSMDLQPIDHVKMQAAIQRWTDASISKTVNCPAEWTVEQVKELYMLMYDLGCKGGTIYRDQSRAEQVLNLETQAPVEKPVDIVEKVKESSLYATLEAIEALMIGRCSPGTNLVDAVRNIIYERDRLLEKVDDLVASKEINRIYSKSDFLPRPNKRNGVTVTKKTPAGNTHITVTMQNNEPIEIFIEIGKGGSDLKAMAEALGRILSLILRLNSPVPNWVRVKEIVNQLEDIGGRNSIGMGPNRVLSLPDAVGQTLRELFTDTQVNGHSTTSVEDWGFVVMVSGDCPVKSWNGGESSESAVAVKGADLCPTCGVLSFVREEGCMKCKTCGYSQC